MNLTPELEAKLVDYLNGRLNAADMADIETQLLNDHELGEAFNELADELIPDSDRVDDYVRGLLSPEEAHALEEEAKNNTSLHNLIVERQALTSSIKQMGMKDLISKAEAEVEAEKKRRVFRLIVWASAAMVVGVLLLGGIYFWSENREQLSGGSMDPSASYAIYPVENANCPTLGEKETQISMELFGTKSDDLYYTFAQGTLQILLPQQMINTLQKDKIQLEKTCDQAIPYHLLLNGLKYNISETQVDLPIPLERTN